MNAPAEEHQQVESRLVRPMQVLEHQQCPLALELGESGGEQHPGAGPSIDRREQRAPSLRGDIVQRGERTGREQRIARSPEHAGLTLAPGELPQQAGLADARFPAQQYDTAAVPDGRAEPVRQIGEAGVTFEQFHRTSERRSGLGVVAFRLAGRRPAAHELRVCR
jgi:hypothetical protein